MGVGDCLTFQRIVFEEKGAGPKLGLQAMLPSSFLYCTIVTGADTVYLIARSNP